MGAAQNQLGWDAAVWSDPARMGGEVCFRDTRVPVQSLFDSLSDGLSIAEFLDDFPPVTPEQVECVLRLGAPRA